MKLRKLSAVFLCLVMVFSLLPFYAFAQDETYYFLQISTDGNSWDNYNASETLSFASYLSICCLMTELISSGLKFI